MAWSYRVDQTKGNGKVLKRYRNQNALNFVWWHGFVEGKVF